MSRSNPADAEALATVWDALPEPLRRTLARLAEGPTAEPELIRILLAWPDLALPVRRSLAAVAEGSRASRPESRRAAGRPGSRG